MINFLSYKSDWGLELKEDSMTSLILEPLLFLPNQIFLNILKDSAHIDINNWGSIIDVSFWPHWNAEGTSNTNYVEPDVFISFENLDLIIEAKAGLHNKQYIEQWENEIISYTNEYGNTKEKILLAIDGNVNHHREEIFGKVKIYKTSWQKIYNSFTKYKHLLPQYKANIIDMAFKLVQIVPYSPLTDLLLSNYNIDCKSILTLHNYFQIK